MRCVKKNNISYTVFFYREFNMKDELLKYYPMIHQDKMIYEYEKGTIRIGTDDNDVIEITDKENKLLPLLNMLDGNNNVEKILSSFPWINLKSLSLLIVKLSKAHSLSLLNEPLSVLTSNDEFKSDCTYYYSEGLNGQDIIKKIKNLKVTIFGVGGGGSLLALQLTNLGVRHIHLVDNDKIDKSNLHRQFLFKNDDIGKFKVDVVQQFLKSRNSNVKITVSKKKIISVNSAIDEIETNESNCAFCCMDEPPYVAQRIINRASYIKQIPSLYGFSSRDACKMLMVNPNKSGCIDCLLNATNDTEFEKLVYALRKNNFKPTTPIIIPNLMLETSWMVKKWLDQITNKRQQWNVLYRFDYNSLKEKSFVSFERQSDCPTCGTESNNKLWQIIPIK